MAYNEEEITFGDVPERDGEGYDPLSPTPKLEDVLNRLGEEEIVGDIVIVAVGDLDSPGRGRGKVSHFAQLTDVETLVEADRRGGSMLERWQRVFNPVTPFRHIQAIIIRPI